MVVFFKFQRHSSLRSPLALFLMAKYGNDRENREREKEGKTHGGEEAETQRGGGEID